MDFYRIVEKTTKNNKIVVYPEFLVGRSKDLMIRAKTFYAIWDEDRQIWSTNEYDLVRIVDSDLRAYRSRMNAEQPVGIRYIQDFDSGVWLKYRHYVSKMYDNFERLDENITFSNSVVKKEDYVSRKLSYPLGKGDISAYDELIGTLYDPEERAKLEWAIGSIVSGDSKDIQKFIVLYGEAGSGKSTFLNILQKLFDGYYTTFEAKALGSNNNAFSTESFRDNPLLAIQHDGDLSKIEDNTKLNSIISHEEMSVNEKYKPSYTSRYNCFLFMGTNKPVKITDSKSGIIRRLIDVTPSSRKVQNKRYHTLVSRIDFELGAIAYHCLQIYKRMGPNYYSAYRPFAMMMETDVFFNFVEACYDEFRYMNSLKLSTAWSMYKTYCTEALLEYKLPLHKFREELKNYFEKFHSVTRIDGKQIRSWYSNFRHDKFDSVRPDEAIEANELLVLNYDESTLDNVLSDCPAQYATANETPIKKWDDCRTKMSDIDSRKLHYVRPPPQYIVVDFDLKDDDGKKSLGLNLAAASKWPMTYAEFSKSGLGIHLYYIYDGDISRLSGVYSDGIEIKTFIGKSAIRRRLTKCNNASIATLNSGLPLKEERPMVNLEVLQNEKHIRNMILRNLNKEIHSDTKSSIDFIYKILDDAYKSGVSYDVSDLYHRVLTFAHNSTNQSVACCNLVDKMKFASEEASPPIQIDDGEMVFFDVEIFPNLFIVCWKRVGGEIVKMINPTSSEIEPLLKLKLVGFNCRRYDNHILYGRYIGYDNQKLYRMSQRIINSKEHGNSAMIREAYNISYTDVYDFSSAVNKKSLKKWEVELGVQHMELGLKWDDDVPVELWDKVADYCANDVNATEAVFNHLKGDWAARQILAELSGLSVNDTTNQHTTKIVFGNERNPQSQFNCPDLREIFPGYMFESGKSTYRGFEVGEGGYVYAEPGMYTDVSVLDIASMHPTSIEVMNLFGPYTKNFNDLKAGRMAIKRNDLDVLKTLLGGKLAPFVEDALGDNPKFTMKDLSNGLKTAINSAYGLTSAGFDNPFRDVRNKDNVVAKRGALFMVDLQFAVQEKGFTVAHIKTDSIKIPNATKEIIDFVFEFGKKYGYDFEHEVTFDKFCLINNAVYIAKERSGEWTPTGAQFAHPYVFKTLFSKEPIVFKDMCEMKTVTTAIYLDMNESLPNGEHCYKFVGKTGLFCPIKSGCGGGLLLREKGDKYDAVGGSKKYRWLEAEIVRELDKEADIDKAYYEELVNDAIKDISEFGDFEWFVSDNKERSPCGSNQKFPCDELPF